MRVCRGCKRELLEEHRETEEERYERVGAGMVGIFRCVKDDGEYYAHNYAGKSKVMTYRCRKCGVVSGFKPHNANWYLMEKENGRRSENRGEEDGQKRRKRDALGFL